MATRENILNIVLDGTGTEIPTLNISDSYSSYLLTGTVTTTGNYAIVPTGSPQLGNEFVFEFNGTLDITTNGNTFSLFGLSITQAQLQKLWAATCKYNGSSWDVILQLSLGQSSVISSNNIGTGTIVNSNIANSTIDGNTKLVNLSVTTSKINDLAVTTGKINDLAVTSAKIAADSVITAKILDDNVTNAKLAEMANNTVKANISGGLANPSDVSISTLGNSFFWSITGNSGTSAGTNFIGTTDAQDLVFKVNNTESGRVEGNGGQNTSFGKSTLINVTTSNSNTAIGFNSLINQVGGGSNVGVGVYSLEQSINGLGNVALGNSAGNTITSGNYNTIIGTTADVIDASAQYRIALGALATADADYQFAIPDDVTHLKFALNTHTNGAILTTDSSGYGVWNVPSINTTAGDSATINAISGRFRKDTSGSTFTLTNSFINANSIILLTMVQLDATATRAVVSAGSGSATITFDAAPTSNLDVNFLVIN